MNRFREHEPASSTEPGIRFRETTAATGLRRGRAPISLSEPFVAVLDEYTAALRSAPLSDQTRRTYASKVRQYLAWLADADTEGDPLRARDARDWAVRDYRSHLQTALKRSPATINNALAAVDDLYIRRGLGPASATRADLPRTAPNALSTRVAVRFLREVQTCPSPRDRAIALVPFYAGTRIAEIIALDVDDVRLSAQGDPAGPRQGREGPPDPDPPRAAHRPDRLAGRTRRLARRRRPRPVFSTSAAAGCRSRARTTSSPRPWTSCSATPASSRLVANV